MHPITITTENQIATVTLNRPEKRNALSLEMFEAIVSAQRQLKKSKQLRAIIIRGAGEDFCSGLDVKSVLSSQKTGFKLLWKWLPWQANLAQKVSVGWREIPVPVVAAIHGRCWGGGLQIALGCDFRIATPDADLSIMEGKWGLIPDMGGTTALREIMPRDQAMLWAMSANTFNAEQAKECGVLTMISSDVDAAAKDILSGMLPRSPDAIAAVKKLYSKHWLASIGKLLCLESWYQWRILLGKNQRIAVAKQQGKDRTYQAPMRW
ncbi:crotonase/enoyl-CoA hydratase family protein [Corallincola platygyrae]|uniref:Crotonase/enoyl-CoA hydratase family protein n=1 Tax=Corallincola platygyrae TaxID=1193278 RepID=A0ABW4XKM3_9GAMM